MVSDETRINSGKEWDWQKEMDMSSSTKDRYYTNTKIPISRMDVHMIMRIIYHVVSTCTDIKITIDSLLVTIFITL